MLTMTADRRAVLVGAAAALAAARASVAQTARPAIERLIASMTPEEKAGQLTILPAATQATPATAVNPASTPGTAEEQAALARAGRLGAVFNAADPAWHRRMQDAALASRLKIPLLFAADVIHGFKTVFPVPLAEAASFDPELARRTARVAAEEATAAGIAWNFAPMVDVARDARWGRGVEGAGEDVWLSERFAEARVRGFQGARGLADAQAMCATPKHFAAYGAATAGLDYNGADVPERVLREVYLPPFRAGFRAGAAATMAAFNTIDGVPAHGNAWLLTELLRREWGFQGLVVSDYTGDMELIAHGLARDERDAARLAILAGVDMSMASRFYLDHLPGLVASGEVPVARVDEAVRRVLELKAALGLFDDAFGRLRAPGEPPRARALAREAARGAIVLLKNDGVLPLSKAGRRIALIGPFAGGPADLNGPWTVFGDPGEAVPLDAGLRAAMADASALSVVRGCAAEAAIPGGIAAAVAAARAADVVVLAIGESERMSGEAQSRTEIVVPAPQMALAEAVAAVGKPVVVALRNGRALALDGAVARANAILVGWFLGAQTGTALADVIFGDVSPSGRLPVSFPQRSGQAPFWYSRERTGRPPLTLKPGEEYKARYREALHEAAYPFGHGLTYGDIVYDALDTGGGRLVWDGRLEVAATVRNRGRAAAVETAQLYIHDRAASIVRPIRELKGVRRVALAPGASARVTFMLTRADLRFIGRDLKPVAEPGLFDVWIAPSATTGVQGTFELVRAG